MPEIRKTILTVEEIHHEGGPAVARPLRLGSIAAVVKNPFAGGYEADLVGFMQALKPLGRELAERLIAALGDSGEIQSYGKGAIVGGDGEIEHGAMWHEPGGWGMREALGGTLAIVPSNKVVGAIGTRLMVPLSHINAAYVRGHFASAEIGIYDAPRRDEIVYGLVMATGGRIHDRLGGLAVADIKGEDGLR
ncbi:amino acid synthesis family protein [Woeseia oceani]|uniref:Amino acid synthesis family protein n=1 Tax=Woeseia oceani TaxID=1548547 RepID=A0A193LDK6_9GAMM|nr:amino acid synthesis family protein [Woeseia oceani]ANO50521.1 hypothetical protein BA177_04210 [Woeseia oceani]